MPPLDFNFLVLLDRLLDKHPGSMVSGYRTDSHNRSVGGANNSGHKYGKAQDLIFDSEEDLIAAAAEAVLLGFSGVELDLSNYHLHVDLVERVKAWHVVKKKGGKEEALAPFLAARLTAPA